MLFLIYRKWLLPYLNLRRHKLCYNGKNLRNRSLVDQFGLSPNVEVDRFYIIWFIINLYFYL